MMNNNRWIFLLLSSILVIFVTVSQVRGNPVATDEDQDVLNVKRAWSEMKNGWGKRAWTDMRGGYGKRGWEKMNGAWGKRASPEADMELEELLEGIDKRPDWSKLKGSWGKRANSAGGWGNLKGVWGKRSWDKLGSSWGKRSIDNDELAV